MFKLLKYIYSKMFLYSTKALYLQCKDFMFKEFWLLGIILLMLLLALAYDLISMTYYTICTIIFIPFLLLLGKSGVSMWLDTSEIIFAFVYEIINDLIDVKEVEFDVKTK